MRLGFTCCEPGRADFVTDKPQMPPTFTLQFAIATKPCNMLLTNPGLLRQGRRCVSRWLCVLSVCHNFIVLYFVNMSSPKPAQSGNLRRSLSPGHLIRKSSPAMYTRRLAAHLPLHRPRRRGSHPQEPTQQRVPFIEPNHVHCGSSDPEASAAAACCASLTARPRRARIKRHWTIASL